MSHRDIVDKLKTLGKLLGRSLISNKDKYLFNELHHILSAVF